MSVSVYTGTIKGHLPVLSDIKTRLLTDLFLSMQLPIPWWCTAKSKTRVGGLHQPHTCTCVPREAMGGCWELVHLPTCVCLRTKDEAGSPPCCGCIIPSDCVPVCAGDFHVLPFSSPFNPLPRPPTPSSSAYLHLAHGVCACLVISKLRDNSSLASSCCSVHG